MVPQIANAKRIIMVNNAAPTNGETSAGFVDTIGYDFLSVAVLAGTSNAVTNKPATLRILESDLTTSPTAPTNYATISGFVSGTDYTIPAAISSATSISAPYAVFNVPLNARKRYIRIEVSPVTTQGFTVLGDLTRAGQTPASSLTGTLVVNGG